MTRILPAAIAVVAVFVGACGGSLHLKVGAEAPTFTLPYAASAGDGTLNLQERRGHWTVLYFYPKDGTPGCTTQACAFRDAIEPIRAKGCEVYGISTDDMESHREFIREHGLRFALLADTEGAVAELYGADGPAGFDHRWTFLVDPELKIRWIQRDVDPALNAKEVLEQLDKRQAGG